MCTYFFYIYYYFFCFKQKTAYEMRISDWSSDVCSSDLRPDGEAGDQPGFSEIEQAAQSLGMAATYLPVESGKVTDQQAQAFGTLMTQLPGPVFAYCRT